MHSKQYDATIMHENSCIKESFTSNAHYLQIQHRTQKHKCNDVSDNTEKVGRTCEKRCLTHCPIQPNPSLLVNSTNKTHPSRVYRTGIGCKYYTNTNTSSRRQKGIKALMGAEPAPLVHMGFTRCSLRSTTKRPRFAPTHLFTYLPILLLTYAPTYLLTCSPVHQVTCSIKHLLTWTLAPTHL